MSKTRAFTLIEIVIVVFILLLLVGMSVPSLVGVLAEKRLRHSYDTFNALVHQAQERSISEHRAYLLVWTKESVALRPEVLLKGDDPNPVAEFVLERNESLTLDLTAALTRTPPAEWIFWPTGNCEPASVKFVGPAGTWDAKYSPLTARGELSNYAVR